MRKLKKITILEDSKVRSFGGGQCVSLQIINILKKFVNTNIIIWDSCEDSKFQEYLEDEKKQLCRYFYKLNVNQSDKLNASIKSSFSVPFFSFVIEFITIFPLSILKLNSEKSDIYISSTKKTHLIILLTIILFQYKEKIVLLYHHSFYPKEFKSRLYIKTLDFLIKISSKRNKILNVFVSNHTLKSYTKKFSLFNKVVYNSAINENHLKEIRQISIKLLSQEKKIIGVYGSLIPWKGIIQLISAFKKLSYDEKSKYNLFIYGDGPLRNKIKKQIQSTDFIYYKGFKKPLEIFNECSIIINSSIYPEACPLTVIEPLAAGKPTFSLNIGGQAEILSYMKLDIKNNDIHSLLKSIIYLSNKDLITISKKSYEVYEKYFSYSIFSEKINTLIKKDN